MIDSLTFENDHIGSAPLELNSVVNGAGFAVTGFEVSTSIRYTEQARPMSIGNIDNPFNLGKTVVRIEGELMDATPTLYWTRRNLLLSHFTPTGSNTVVLGSLRLATAGFPETLEMRCYPESWPEIPIGLMGATISKYMIQLASPLPWWQGSTRSQNFVANAAAAALTDFGVGNAPSWPVWVITGPITNPSVEWQGASILSIAGTVAAGTTVTIDPLFRTIRGNSINWYPLLTLNFGWKWLDPRTVVSQGKNVRLVGTGATGASNVQVQYKNSWIL